MSRKRTLLSFFVAVFATTLAFLPGSASALGRTNQSTAGNGHYVALGDSVAAGVGLFSSGGVCGRSSQGLNYPSLVATSLNKPLTDASCSGATVGDLFTRQSVEGPDIPAQLDTAFANGTPSIMTLTAGANDLHWAEIVKACLSSANCDNGSYSFTIQAYLALTRAKLHIALTDIAWRSGGKAQAPQVYVTGYYSPFSAACSTLVPNLTANEISWITRQNQALNSMIEQVSSRYSFVKFVPVNFDGHEVCTPDPWVQGFADAAPFHPTAKGQRIIAGAVLNKINEN
jgi:lysophospholipase L1-like esterase